MMLRKSVSRIMMSVLTKDGIKRDSLSGIYMSLKQDVVMISRSAGTGEIGMYIVSESVM